MTGRRLGGACCGESRMGYVLPAWGLLGCRRGYWYGGGESCSHSFWSWLWSPMYGQDEVLFSIAEDVRNFCVIYLVDTNTGGFYWYVWTLWCMHHDVFFRNKHIMVDTSTGNNNKINWVVHDRQDVIDLIEVVWRPRRKGLVSAKDYNTKYKY